MQKHLAMGSAALSAMLAALFSRHHARPGMARRMTRAEGAKYLLLTLAALLPGIASANLCPADMDVRLPKAQEAPAGWEHLLQKNRPPLTSVRLFDGPPDSAPEIRPKVRQANYLRWEFRIASKQGPVSATAAASAPASSAATSVAAAATSPSEVAALRPLWIKCSYGEPGITLLRPLPADFSVCTLKCVQGCQLWCR